MIPPRTGTDFATSKPNPAGPAQCLVDARRRKWYTVVTLIRGGVLDPRRSTGPASSERHLFLAGPGFYREDLPRKHDAVKTARKFPGLPAPTSPRERAPRRLRLIRSPWFLRVALESASSVGSGQAEARLVHRVVRRDFGVRERARICPDAMHDTDKSAGNRHTDCDTSV